MQKGDLILKQVVYPTKKGKLHYKWEGPYKLVQKLSHGAYKLESLIGRKSHNLERVELETLL